MHPPGCSRRPAGRGNQEDTHSGTTSRELGHHVGCIYPCWLHCILLAVLPPAGCTAQPVTHLARSVIYAACRLGGAAGLIGLAGVHSHADPAVTGVAQVTGAQVLTRSSVDAGGLWVAGPLETWVLGWGCKTGKLWRSRPLGRLHVSEPSDRWTHTGTRLRMGGTQVGTGS